MSTMRVPSSAVAPLSSTPTRARHRLMSFTFSRRRSQTFVSALCFFGTTSPILSTLRPEAQDGHALHNVERVTIDADALHASSVQDRNDLGKPSRVDTRRLDVRRVELLVETAHVVFAHGRSRRSMVARQKPRQRLHAITRHDSPSPPAKGSVCASPDSNRLPLVPSVTTVSFALASTAAMRFASVVTPGW